MKYTPTLHAIERAKHRLGIAPVESQRWFNEIMRKAAYLFTQKNAGKTQAVYETEEVRLIVDTTSHTIVTIYPILDTTFLKPVFEREGRRIKREVTRKTRAIELRIAELTVEKGERMLAKAKAKNPKTRDLIQREINVILTTIDVLEAEMTREFDRLDQFTKAVSVYA